MLTFRKHMNRWSVCHVNGQSMEPSLKDGDLLLISRSPVARLHRGAVVIVSSPEAEGGAQVKRMIGLPGDTVALEDGSLLINDEPLHEPYLGGLPQTLGLGSRRWTVGDGECFVLGDNRAHSTDSREYGPVLLSAILGVVKVRLWPMLRRRLSA